jgi:hypothetical protein
MIRYFTLSQARAKELLRVEVGVAMASLAAATQPPYSLLKTAPQ